MIGRLALVVSAALAAPLLTSADAPAQDVPGIEICTVEKTMERRTSCLQSNVDFLQRTITKLGADHQQKLDAANRQIEGLKSSVASLQKIVEDLQAAQKKAAEDQKKSGQGGKVANP
jgi:TolA-binding protein